MAEVHISLIRDKIDMSCKYKLQTSDASEIACEENELGVKAIL